eukprot:SAG31_NODE_495_length_14864_cov_21.943109_6_plen_62_part_00
MIDQQSDTQVILACTVCTYAHAKFRTKFKFSTAKFYKLVLNLVSTAVSYVDSCTVHAGTYR